MNVSHGLRGHNPVGVVAACVALIACAAALYGTRLAEAPAYLAHDEIKFALQAQSVASTGRDLNGVFLPLYFSEPEFRGGRDPMIIYATALALKVLPLSETAIRAPTALVGIVDIVLMFLVARRVLSSAPLGLIAAGLIATTPAHFIHARFGLDVLYPLPFVLAWLLALTLFLERGGLVWLVVSTVCLGAGVYSYLPALAMMPLFLLFTCLALLRRPDRVHLWAWAAAGFLAALAPLAAWQIAHPARYAELVAAYRPESAAAQSIGATLVAAIEAYWNFFNPGFLFFTGDSSLVNSTRNVGVFLLPAGVLMAIGLHRMCTSRRSALALIVIGGFLAAPAAAAAMGVVEIRRALLMLPFAALIAAFGAEALIASRRRLVRTTLIVWLALGALQFRGFYADYFGPHRVQSAVWFGGNVRGAVTEAMAAARQTPAPEIYLSGAIPYVDAYWRFYALAEQASGPPAIVYADPSRLERNDVAAGALRVCDVAEFSRSRGADAWQPARVVAELDGTPSFVVARRR